MVPHARHSHAYAAQPVCTAGSRECVRTNSNICTQPRLRLNLKTAHFIAVIVSKASVHRAPLP